MNNKDNGHVNDESLEVIVKNKFADYATYVWQTRALPDVRDGLKVGQRRTIYAMKSMGLLGGKFTKCAGIVGETLKSFHPHGDQACYGSLVNMVRPDINNAPLAEGEGNFGDKDDSAAAMRYCLTLDSLVMTDKGLVTMGSFGSENESDININVMTRDGKWSKANKYFHCGEHETYKIKTNLGFVNEGTGNHGLLTWSQSSPSVRPSLEWKTMDTINSGDYVVLHAGYGSDHSDTVEPDFHTHHDIVSSLFEYLENKYKTKINELYVKDQSNAGNDLDAFLEHVDDQDDVELVKWVLTGNWLIDQVESCCATGEFKEVASIRVDSDCHSYVANGFVNHNTEARLAPISKHMLQDMEAVEFVPNYNETVMEPTVLPSEFPHLLVNGSSGIGVGIASHIPSHNLSEVIEATIALINNPKASLEDIIDVLPAPDFPTEGIIALPSLHESKKHHPYEHGGGENSSRWIVRGEIKREMKGAPVLNVISLPPSTSPEKFIDEVKKLVSEGKIPEITEIINESDMSGTCISIRLKKGSNSEVVESEIYRLTSLQENVQMNAFVLADERPERMGVIDIIHEWIHFRRVTVKKRLSNHIEDQQQKLRKLNLLAKVLRDVKRAARIIIESNSPINDLVEEFNITPEESKEVMDWKLARMTKSNIESVLKERQTVMNDIEYTEKLLGSNRRIDTLIEKELRAIQEAFPSPRKTKIASGAFDLSTKRKPAPAQKLHVSINKNGRIKAIPVASSGCKSSSFIARKVAHRNDIPSVIHPIDSDGDLAVFTASGKCYKIHMDKIKIDTDWEPIEKYISGKEDPVVAAHPVSSLSEDGHIALMSSSGIGKLIAAIDIIKSSRSMQLINIDEGQYLSLASPVSDMNNSSIFYGTTEGRTGRIELSGFKTMGRQARGNKVCKLKGDTITYALAGHNDDMLVRVFASGKIMIDSLDKISTSSGRKSSDEILSSAIASHHDILMVHQESEGGKQSSMPISTVKSSLSLTENENLLWAEAIIVKSK